MKLFKRTSITLGVLMVLLWVFLFIWVYYPIGSVRVTDVEIEQTRMLLEESNISAADGFLKQKGKSVNIPEITYIMENSDVLDKACAEGKIKKDAENEYSFDESYITIYDKIVIIEGKSEIADKVTPESAPAKAKKLIQWLGLSYKNMSWHATETKKGMSVIFIPMYDGKMIFDCKINVSLYGEGSYRVQTTPLSLKSKEEKRLSGSGCSALAELAMSNAANGSEIVEMTLGYKTSGNKLKPVWEVKTDDDNTYYID